MFSANSSQVSNDANYIEDVFSTYLYTGTTSAQTITNGIDLSTKGGLVWIKNRIDSGIQHRLMDTVRGASYRIASNSTAAQSQDSQGLTSFNTNGFSLGNSDEVNYSGNFVSWTFRKQPKFFDVVTWTGNGADTRYIFHSLTGTTGCVIAKRTDSSGNWIVGHRSITPGGENLLLNSTSAKNSNYGTIHNLDAYSGTAFGVYNGFGSTDPANYLNVNGATYVAYVFAHNAGGFGLTGTDNVISCGSFTTSNGDGLSGLVNTGFEPQWVMIKRTDSSSGDWQIYDNMRGVVASNNGGTYLQPSQFLNPNLAAAEGTDSYGLGIYQNGFNFNNGSGVSTYIYIAIRRGPMKVPTSGTSVFSPIARSGNGSVGVAVTGAGFPPDLVATKARNAGQNNLFADRLRGIAQLYPDATYSEGTNTNDVQSYDMDGMTLGSGNGVNGSGTTYINWLFRRAPSFFDEVCYTGGSSPPNTFAHNLGVAPELMIIKSRNNAYSWFVYSQAVGVAPHLRLNTTDAATTGTAYLSAAPDASNFYLNGTALCNNTGDTYVAYLFATCAGVSKVGSYTGTGTTLQVNCGFTGGARFVLIKRTDSTGSWYVWDVARGISSGNDPYLLLNSTAAEVTSTDYIDAYSAGFEISSTAPAEINASGGSFIFLAIS